MQQRLSDIVLKQKGERDPHQLLLPFVAAASSYPEDLVETVWNNDNDYGLDEMTIDSLLFTPDDAWQSMNLWDHRSLSLSYRYTTDRLLSAIKSFLLFLLPLHSLLQSSLSPATVSCYCLYYCLSTLLSVLWSVDVAIEYTPHHQLLSIRFFPKAHCVSIIHFSHLHFKELNS